MLGVLAKSPCARDNAKRRMGVGWRIGYMTSEGQICDLSRKRLGVLIIGGEKAAADQVRLTKYYVR